MVLKWHNHKTPESGMALVTVLMAIIVMTVISVGVISSTMNQSASSQAQIDQIYADQLAKGIFWNAYSAGTIVPTTFTLINDKGKTFTALIIDQGNNSYSVKVSY